MRDPKDGPRHQNEADVEQVVGLIGQMVKKRDNDCSAFVIAGDPIRGNCMRRARS